MSNGAVPGGLEFAVLGPVEARRDGTTLPLGGIRQRGLLAILVLHHGEAVSADRLVEDLFGADSGNGAANALQQTVSRLRRTLGDGASIVTRAPGYALAVASDQVDLHRFEELRLAAHNALAGGEFSVAAAQLRQALALWRGEPLADLAELDFAQTEIRRLDELRLAALMDRIDADLALGNASGLVTELESLVDANPFQEPLRGQLMRALYRDGRQADALQAFRDTSALLRDELGLEPSRSLQELERAILTHDASLDPVRRAPADDVAVPVCPYKGLAPFELDDARFFCGRERVVDDLVARLAEGTLVGIIGPSGIGKSSVLRAGLLRALASGALPGSETWPVVVLRPGAHPAAELERIPVGGARTVIAVDQFEELFTVCDDESERGAFVEALVAAARDPERRTIVALALRADFYGRCATYPALAELLSARHVLVGPMQPDELARAITVPAERAGLVVEDDLAAALVADVAGEPGGLPLLQTALLEQWRRRDGSTLRVADYRQAGGVHGAVGRLADATYDGLDDHGKQIVRTLMLRLAAGDADNAVRRRVPATQLTQGKPEITAVLDALVEARLLTADDGSVEVAHEALLREWPRMRAWLEEDRESRRLEAQVRKAAAEWTDGGRDRADLYRGPRLAAVLDWHVGHESELDPVEAEFVSASREAGERELHEQRRRNRRLRLLAGGIFALLVLALIAGGAALIQRGRARNEARAALAHQLGAEALTAPRLDQAMLLAREAVNLSPSVQTEGTLLATLLRTPTAIGTFSSPLTSRPQRLSVSPDGRTLGVADNTGYVRFYDLASRRLVATVRNLGYGTPPAYTSNGADLVAFAGSTYATLAVMSSRRLRTTAILHLNKPFFDEPPCGTWLPTFGPGGTTVFITYCMQRPDGSDGPAFLDEWNASTGRRIVTARPLRMRGANTLQLLAGGRLLAVGDDAAVTLDARTLRAVGAPRHFSTRIGFANPTATSKNGRMIAVGEPDGTIDLVDLTNGRLRKFHGAQAGGIDSIDFSPNGRIVASGAEDGSIFAYDVSSGMLVDRFTGHESRVLGLSFSPDSKTLYSSSLDGAIFIWDLGKTRRFGVPFGTSTGPLFVVGLDEQEVAPPLAVSPDSQRFAMRVGRSQIAIIDVSDGRRVSSFHVDVGGNIAALAWSPQGRLAVSGDGGHVQLWDVSGGPRLIRRLRGIGPTNGLLESVTTLAFSPDGSLLAGGDVNHTPYSVPWRFGTAAVWDASSGRLLWKARSKRGWVTGVAFSPDGKTIAAGDESNVVQTYDARSGRPETTIHTAGSRTPGYVSVAFSPAGKLATGDWAGVVQLWDPSSGREIARPILAAPAPVSSIDFDPNGRTFATTGGSDGIARLWSTANLQQFGSNLPGASSFWGNAQFTRDGKHLVVVWVDGTGSVWPTSMKTLEQHACAVAGRNFTPTEWRQFVGNAYRTTCPGQPGVSGA